MKCRTGFVSNSSSSSFIIGKAQVGEEKFAKVVAYLTEEGIGFDLEAKGNYIFCDTSEYGFDEDQLTDMGIGENDYFTRYD